MQSRDMQDLQEMEDSAMLRTETDGEGRRSQRLVSWI
jgi:hypothetical protein